MSYTKSIIFQTEKIRNNLPGPDMSKIPNPSKDYHNYTFRRGYKENRFHGKSERITPNDIKCHMLAGKWGVLELRK